MTKLSHYYPRTVDRESTQHYLMYVHLGYCGRTYGQGPAHLSDIKQCWGSGNTILKTLKGNLAQHIAGLLLVSLPATFKDAVLVSRYLGFEYLWIDALCIIQDEESDWQHECSFMQDIYQRSSLTIAAGSAKDSISGFLRFRDTRRPSPCLLPRQESTRACPQIVAYPDLKQERLTNYLSDRAWVRYPWPLGCWTLLTFSIDLARAPPVAAYFDVQRESGVFHL